MFERPRDRLVMNIEPIIGRERSSKRREALLVVAVALMATALSVHAGNSTRPVTTSGNEFPADVDRLLRSADKATLYSLEPWDVAAPTEATLHGFKIIGQMDLDRGLKTTVVARFKKAISSRTEPIAMCFDPRHALRVTSGAESYDLLLC